MAAVRDRWRERELGSSKRAGSWSRQQARKLQLEFIKRHRRTLLMAIGATLLMTPLTLLFSEGQRWFLLGVLAAGLPALLFHVIVLASGSTPYLVGDLGEQWTHDEIKSLQRSGWRIVHQLVFRAGSDIDTILVGPSGVVVLETKWSNDGWTSPKQEYRVREAVRQVQGNAKIVERQIRQQIGPTKTAAAVVLWPSDRRLKSRQIDDVAVLPGWALRAWLDALPLDQLDGQRSEAAWSFLKAHATNRSDWEREHGDPVPRTAGRYAADAAQYPMGALLGLFATTGIVSIFGWPASLGPLTVLGALAAAVQRVRSLRRAGMATLAVVLALVAAFAAASIMPL